MSVFSHSFTPYYLSTFRTFLSHAEAKEKGSHSQKIPQYSVGFDINPYVDISLLFDPLVSWDPSKIISFLSNKFDTEHLSLSVT